MKMKTKTKKILAIVLLLAIASSVTIFGLFGNSREIDLHDKSSK
jgi:hypothetical protein